MQCSTGYTDSSLTPTDAATLSSAIGIRELEQQTTHTHTHTHTVDATNRALAKAA